MVYFEANTISTKLASLNLKPFNPLFSIDFFSNSHWLLLLFFESPSPPSSPGESFRLFLTLQGFSWFSWFFWPLLTFYDFSWLFMSFHNIDSQILWIKVCKLKKKVTGIKAVTVTDRYIKTISTDIKIQFLEPFWIHDSCRPF